MSCLNSDFSGYCFLGHTQSSQNKHVYMFCLSWVVSWQEIDLEIDIIS